MLSKEQEADLGVTSKELAGVASKEDALKLLRTRWRRVQLRVHPDRPGGDAAAAKRVNEAFQQAAVAVEVSFGKRRARSPPRYGRGDSREDKAMRRARRNAQKAWARETKGGS